MKHELHLPLRAHALLSDPIIVRKKLSFKREKWLWQPLIVFSRVCFFSALFFRFGQLIWSGHKEENPMSCCKVHRANVSQHIRPSVARRAATKMLIWNIYAHEFRGERSDEINYSPSNKAVNSKICFTVFGFAERNRETKRRGTSWLDLIKEIRSVLFSRASSLDSPFFSLLKMWN